MLNITFWKGYTVWTRTLCLLATCPRLFSIFLLFKSVPGSQGLSPFGACGSSVKFLIPTIVVYNIFQEGLKITVVDQCVIDSDQDMNLKTLGDSVPQDDPDK